MRPVFYVITAMIIAETIFTPRTITAAYTKANNNFDLSGKRSNHPACREK